MTSHPDLVLVKKKKEKKKCILHLSRANTDFTTVYTVHTKPPSWQSVVTLLKILYHQSNMAVNTFYLKTTGTSFVNVMSCYSQVGFEKIKIKLTGVMCLSVVIILLRTVHKSGPTILMQGDMTELLLFTTV